MAYKIEQQDYSFKVTDTVTNKVYGFNRGEVEYEVDGTKFILACYYRNSMKVFAGVSTNFLDDTDTPFATNEDLITYLGTTVFKLGGGSGLGATKEFIHRVEQDGGILDPNFQVVREEYNNISKYNWDLLLIPSAYKAGKLYSILPQDGSGDFTVDRNGEGTRVNKEGLIESMPSDVPRLGYDDSGNLKGLLVEEQDTNLLSYSEDGNNFRDSSLTQIIPNAGIAPDGSNSATFVQFGAGASYVGTIDQIPITEGQEYFFSVWIKGVDITSARILFADNKQEDVSSQIINGEWVKVKVSAEATSTGNFTQQFLRSSNANNESFYIWGAQLSTKNLSYIPTNGSQVTRPADVVSLDNVSHLIGQTEGSFYVDFEIPDIGSKVPFMVSEKLNPVGESDDNSMYALYLPSGFASIVFRENNVQTDQLTFSTYTAGRQKIAIVYKDRLVKVFYNGSLEGTITSTNYTFTKVWNSLYFNFQRQYYINGHIKTNAVKKEVLTDQQAIELTTL